MFFVAGMSSKQDELDFSQNIVCSNCGKFGRYEVIMEYMYFSLFFIPLLKWNKKFYVKSSCCNTIYSIHKDLGDSIARKEKVLLDEKDLRLIKSGQSYSINKCSSCGFETHDDFKYCPKCANPL